MKRVIKDLILFLIFYTSKSLHLLTYPLQNRTKAALILAPSLEGSKGDEAIIDTISYQLKKNGVKTTLIHFAEKEWNYLKHIDKWYSISNYFKNGGWIDHIKFISLFHHYTYFYTLGTDMMDGCYAEWLTNGLIKISNHAAYAGLKTTIVGFSLNSWQNKTVIKNIAKMHSSVRFCIRDDVSLKRFEELLPQKKRILTADMAFLLESSLNSDLITQAFSWVNEEKKAGKIVYGINLNPQLYKESENLDLLIQNIIEVIEEIYKNYIYGTAIILIPHDSRLNNSDKVVLDKIFAILKPKLNYDIYLLENQILASDIKALVGVLDFVITARMHVSIACLGQGTPIGCLVYQGKFEGLYNHFKLSNKYILTPERAIQKEELMKFIITILHDRAEIKKKILKYLPLVKERSRLNI